MFNNHRSSNSSLNYSYFSKKYHNDDTFTLAIGLIILALWHLIYVLSNWKFRPQFLSRPQFLKKDPIFKYDGCLRSPHLA